MRDVNKELKIELSKLVTHMKANNINQMNTAEMKRKINTLQTQQHLLLERLEQLSNMVIQFCLIILFLIYYELIINLLLIY